MRRRPLSLAFLVAGLLAAPVHGQFQRFEISAVVEPAGSYSEYQGYDLELGLGGGIAWRFSPHWAIDLRGMVHDAESADATAYQLGLRYAFGGDESRWRPFVVAGWHSQEVEFWQFVDCSISCYGYPASYTDTGLFGGGGVDWQFAKMWALRFEGRIAVYDAGYEGQWGDEGGTQNDIDLTLGVAFRF